MTNFDVDGLASWVSPHSPDDTTGRLLGALRRHDLTLFAQIDHARNAAEAGLELRPMTLFLFGAAASGTRLMQKAATIGIDLPLRMLVWVDGDCATWLGYNEPGWIAARHRARSGNEEVLAGMRRILSSIAEEVTS